MDGDDGDLDGGADADTKKNLVTNVLGRSGANVESVEETGADGGEDCAHEEKWLKVADPANEPTA